METEVDLFALMSSLDDTPVVREDIVRAPFGFPGGKSRSLMEILPKLPQRRGYGEPFGGSGSVLLARSACDLEVFNDRYAGVTVFYRCMRDRQKSEALVERLRQVLHTREEFIWCRDTWKNCEDEVERAARWYYSVLMSFGAQARHFGRAVDGKGQQGPKLWNNLKLFPAVHHRMKNVQVENLDYRQCLKDYDRPDFVWYLDPPYYTYNKGMYEHNLSGDEHIELMERVQQLRGFVALSGYDNPVYDRYKWDDKYTWKVRVSMLGMAFNEECHTSGLEESQKRGHAQECLWIRESH